MGWAVLKITDGTTTIDLLNTNGGFLLDDWRPAIQIPKSGGIWNGSPLTDGRLLALRNYDNAIEVFNLKASSESQDGLIRATQDLFRLLDKAVSYWITGWNTNKVWIEARAKEETNSRYALIMDYRVSGLDNPYAQPFFACPSVLDDLTLTIERDYWSENEPGTATAIEISSVVEFGGIDYGREATTDAEVVIVNKHVMANITAAFAYDDSIGGFSGNLIGSGLPYDLLPVLPATGDAIYLGCNTAIGATSGPFSGAIFNITTVAVNISAITWEYWDGAAWSTLLTVVDGTDNFLSTGFKYINFKPPSDWTIRSVGVAPAITGYWIRGVVTVDAATPSPEQGVREIYAPTLPFFDIASNQIPGDVPALAKFYMDMLFFGASVDASLFTSIRSLSRGSNFTPYINLSDEQNQSGIVIVNGADVSAVAYVPAPTGRSYNWNSSSDANALRLSIGFTNALRAHYTGKYILILRAYIATAAANSVQFYIAGALDNGGGVQTIFQTSPQYFSTDYNCYDCGIIEIPDIDTGELSIFIYGSDSAVTCNIYFYDLILIPCDEACFRYGVGSGFTYNDTVILDSITRIKKFHHGLISGAQEMPVKGSGPTIFQANAAQRLWFFLEDNTDNNCCVHSFATQAWRMARYMAMRGNR